MALLRPDSSQVRTLRPDGTGPKYLGAIGYVSAQQYSYTCPGGPDQFSCSLAVDARYRTDALDPGRIVQVIRGASVVWEGKLDEPQPSAEGWQVSAHGAGTFGNDFAAVYSGWTAGVFDDAINQAIARGLRWSNPGLVPGTSWDFEHGTSGWTTSNGSLDTRTDFAHSGTHSLHFTLNDGNPSCLSPPVLTAASSSASGSIWLLTVNPKTVTISVAFYRTAAGGTGDFISQVTGSQVSLPGGTWTQLTLSGTAPAGTVTAKLRVTVTGASSGQTISIDDGSLTPTTSLWTGQQVDSGAQAITDLLNLGTSNGGLTWYVGRPGNQVSIFPLPTVANRLLVATTPVARTLGGDINTVWIRYQSKADSDTGAATYALTSATDAASIARYGPQETFTDLSNAGTMTAAAAQAVGSYVLQRYQRASYAGPFTVGPGQLLTTGGVPVDLGSEQAGTVCRLVLLDFAYGGEVSPQPVTFLVGGYAYDDDSQSAAITPFQYQGNSFSDLLSAAASALPQAS